MGDERRVKSAYLIAISLLLQLCVPQEVDIHSRVVFVIVVSYIRDIVVAGCCWLLVGCRCSLRKQALFWEIFFKFCLVLSKLHSKLPVVSKFNARVCHHHQWRTITHLNTQTLAHIYSLLTLSLVAALLPDEAI